jgi:ubiquinone/menaquinone biosynthesis C-methylase UbiE
MEHRRRPPRLPHPAHRPAKPAPATHWEKAAQWYDQFVGDEGSEYHREVVLPGALRLLAPQPGQRMIDIACGQGVLCRLLAEKGIEATGIDAAEALVRAARERESAAGATTGGMRGSNTAGTLNSAHKWDIRYHVGDARDLSFLPPNSFDAAACVLAIQNIHPIAPVFEGVQRLLRTGGRLVLAMMHPCFRGPKETSWGWDESNKVQYRRVDRYLLLRKTPIITHPGKDPSAHTWTFHKPLEAYVKALGKSGLLIDALEEWPSHKQSTSGPRAPAENVARKEIPMFLALRAIKTGQ